ncbi:hypothetical protein MFLAVUS_005225 [Mucor flavus]|uniref:Uncharacterized protein n=1 Tax=Mucor flavus TaxID=439312 RepID=A0ABP9YY40_9FUNG
MLKDFISKSLSNDTIDITSFYKSIGVRFDDRNTVGCLTKDVINRILEENSEYTVILSDTVAAALFTGDRNLEEIHP